MGVLGFSRFFNFAVCEGVFLGALMLGVYFLSFSFIFFRSIVVYLKLCSRLTKYRCVPKIGFSADISIDILIDISIDIFIDILTDIFIDIFIDMSIDILIDILTDILTDEEEGGGRKEGRSGLFLKI